MKRKLCIKICFILVILIVLIFILHQNKDGGDGKKEISQSPSETQVTENPEPEEKNQGEEKQSNKNISAEMEKALAEEMKREKIELMDYVELPVEEFIEKTGIPLSQVDENTWNTENAENIWYPENASVWLTTDHDKIVTLSVFLRSIIRRGNEYESVFAEAFPYTVAGIRMNMPVSYYRETLLKDAATENISYNSDYYTNLQLSKQGIELLRLEGHMEAVCRISVDIDLSLKENTEGLEYIWEERVCKKKGSRNDRLEISQESYTEFQEYYREKENIDETFVWTRYPYLVIPGKPEMEKNANEVIAEAVEKMWENTYGSTDENIIVDSAYNISYITSKFISIVFYADVIDSSGRKDFWQYCNINIGENGRKAYLSDLGISKERVAARCDAGHELGPVDKESFLENYDTNWDQYYISPTEYTIIVKPLFEEEVIRQYGERTRSLSMTK